MPRRSFFGGGGRDKKSSSKKQSKLSQKYVQESLRQQQLLQQQKQQQQQQQQQQRRPSGSVSDVSRSLRSQTSSSQDTDPHHQLVGPTQTVAYSQYVNDINHQRSPPNSNAFQPSGGNIDGQMMMHQHGTLQQQQQQHHQYQVQPNNLHHHQQQQQQQQQTHQGYDEQGQQHQYQTNPIQHEYVQQYPQQSNDVLPYTSQPYPTTHHGDSSQQTIQHHYQQMTHPIPVPQPHYNVVHRAKPKSLSVANATDEIWRCATDDFRSASHAIQMLRLAIVAEWESQRMMNEESFPKESNGWSYDPSETFLSLQGAALRFHARFEAMKAEKIGVGENPLGSSSGERDGIEWELTEQAAWEVWEESVRASAALSHACVGPAWYRQIRMRRQLLRESEMRLIYHSYIQQQRSLMLCDDRSQSSSIGGVSMSSTIASMDMSASQSIGMMSGMGAAPTINPPTDMLQMISHTIPEVLPAAMIRFAASAIETSIPPLLTKKTKIFWNPNKKNDSEFLLNSLGEHLREERRWLRRRRRLGDTQRDLAFALFCASAKKDKRANGYGNESTASDSAGANWSIPGCHVPVSSMIHSWLATCQAGWPVPNEFEGGKIPSHTENISTDPSEDRESPIPPKEIVLSATNQVDSTKSNDERGVEFSYWGELVDLTTIDWWYTLKVLRDCSDLVAAGWRPPPTGQVGEEIVLSLVSIAEQGLDILFEATEDEEQLQKERLAAVSCASETLMALKNLALRDVLPSDSLYKLVTSLCHFLSAAESTSSDLNEEAAGAMFQKEILAQRQFVAASAAELLWILLSSEDTACTTTDALLDAIDIDLSKTGKLSDEDCARAAGAIRALSAALWGDPPSVKGVPLLRFFWEPVLDILGQVTSTIFHSNDSTIKSSDIAGHMSCLIVLNEGVFDDKLFVIVLEIVLAFRRLVDSEMVYGSGDLCPTEWEAFTKAIDFGLAPWLLYQGEDPLQLEIYDEISAIFFQLQSFLLKCSQIEVGFHQIVDNDARQYLHLFLLRKITPLLQLADAHKTLSLPSLDGTSIALATIKSWCVTGYLPYREGSWSKRASDLLQEAFALCENISDSNFIGGHLHSPVVRLEALKSLVFDSDDVTSSRNSDMMDSDSMSASISTVTSASMKSGYISKHSLFSLTKNLRDLHLELIKTILLPRLISILAPEHQAQISPDIMSLEPTRVASPLANTTCCHSVHTVTIAECLDAIEKECILRKFAIRKVGMIFRSRTGEDECRHQLIELLQLTATVQPRMIEDWARGKGGDDPTNFVEGAARESHHIQVEAIRQLETCLNAPFRELPHTHGSVPTILKALCDTAIAHATEGNNLLTLASILPLARLSCAVNGQGIMMSRRRLTKIVPSDILSAISVDDYWSPTCDLNETLPMVSEDHDFNADKDDVAPLIFVRQTQIEGKKEAQGSKDIGMTTSKFSTRRRSRQKDNGAREGTTVDFEIVAAVIKSVLQTSSSNYQQCNKSLFDRTVSHRSLTELPSVISTICYIALSSFLSHGMAFPSLDDTAWLNIEYSNVGKDNEELLVARSQTIADFAGVLGHNFVYHLGDKKKNRDIARNVCNALVKLAKSKYSRVVTNACCGIILLLSSLRHSRKSAKIKMDDTSSSFLISFIEYTMSVMTEDTDTIILIPLIDAMREVFLCEGSLFRASKSLRRRAYLSCFKLQSNLWSVQAVAFQCAVAIIATMSASEISLMMFVSLAPNHNTTRTNRKRISPLLFDILRTRLLKLRLLGSCNNSETCSFKPQRVHKKLAREALSLESFPIDNVDGCPNVSVWKCGNTILSLRMGSKDSLYRGWMEITMRSPSSRLRRLVQVKRENVCRDPDSLLPFWELLHEESAEQDLPPIAPPTSRIADAEDNEALLKATEMSRSQQDRISALISRFDKVFDAHSSELNLPLPKTKVPKLPSGSLYYSGSTLLRNSKVKTLKRTCSDGDLLATTPLPREEGSPDQGDRASSVYTWLQQATKGCVDSNLIKELESFGFSSSALGVPSIIRDTASSAALYPQVLKPYENKPNFMRSLKILDRLTPFQTHRVALFYGGESGGSDSFLKTKHASPDFWQFSKELGDFVPIRHLKYFSGGLDTSASRSDGMYAIVWFGNQGGSDELNFPTLVDSMVIFHTVTLMPNKETNRKRHVGNDVVHIVYGYEPTANSDEAKENAGSSISGHFGFITIYVVPLVHVDMVKVSVKLKSGLKENIIRSLDHLVGSWLISRRVGAHFVRNLSVQADMICQSLLEDKLGLVLNIEDRSGRIHEMDRHLKSESQR